MMMADLLDRAWPTHCTCRSAALAPSHHQGAISWRAGHTLLAVRFLTGPDAWRPAMLFAAALLIGVCNAFFDPAVNALTPDLVPEDQIEAANALRQSSRQVTVLGAQGVGGILYSLFGPAALFLINGLSFLFAGATELMIKPSRHFAMALGSRSRLAQCGAYLSRAAPG